MGGRRLRLKRFFSKGDGRLVLFPLDHGVSCGPIPGLVDLGSVLDYGVKAGADGVVLHKGMLSYLEPIQAPLPGVFLHLSASTQIGPAFHSKVLVGSVEEAIRRGADGVSVHVNLGDEEEGRMLADLGLVSDHCSRWGLPLLVMIYVRGANAPKPVPDSAVAHAARVAGELGADVVKIPMPENLETLETIARCVPVPVVLAGGAKEADELGFLKKIERGLEAGLAGVAVGRNVFQHKSPETLLRAIVSVVHEGLSAEEAAERWKIVRS